MQRASVLLVRANESFLNDIRAGYAEDDLIHKLINGGSLVPGVERRDSLWYIDNRLYIPKYKSLCEDLFHLAHDTCGHFGGDKSYALLRDSYYWPRMKRDLYKYYIPGCEDCQRNKGRTSKIAKGPLHPLPVPESCCDGIAMDFIGPLPTDEGFDCILTITDRLNFDLKIIPTSINITAQQLAHIFFDEWYCDNGLPLDIVSDRDNTACSNI